MVRSRTSCTKNDDLDFVRQLSSKFGVDTPGEIRWAHSVNTRSALVEALQDDTVDMIEADVMIGKVLRDGREKSLVPEIGFPLLASCVGSRGGPRRGPPARAPAGGGGQMRQRQSVGGDRGRAGSGSASAEIVASSSGVRTSTSSDAAKAAQADVDGRARGPCLDHATRTTSTSSSCTSSSPEKQTHSEFLERRVRPPEDVQISPKTPVHPDCVILSHFPYSRSDLSLDDFLEQICAQNDLFRHVVDRKPAERGPADEGIMEKKWSGHECSNHGNADVSVARATAAALADAAASASAAAVARDAPPRRQPSSDPEGLVSPRALRRTSYANFLDSPTLNDRRPVIKRSASADLTPVNSPQSVRSSRSASPKRLWTSSSPLVLNTEERSTRTFSTTETSLDFLSSPPPNNSTKTPTTNKNCRPVGIKLDFKSEAAVRPAIDLLLRHNVFERLPSVWLNADVLYGPSTRAERWIKVLNPKHFVQECARCVFGGGGSSSAVASDATARDDEEPPSSSWSRPDQRLDEPSASRSEGGGASIDEPSASRSDGGGTSSSTPAAPPAVGGGEGGFLLSPPAPPTSSAGATGPVLSLSWLTVEHAHSSKSREYTAQMIHDMMQLVLFPLVDDGSGLIRSPANCFPHITFGVCAAYAARSHQVLQKLLLGVPSASLTLFSGSFSQGISAELCRGLAGGRFFDRDRCFLDVKISGGGEEEGGKSSSSSSAALGEVAGRKESGGGHHHVGKMGSATAGADTLVAGARRRSGVQLHVATGDKGGRMGSVLSKSSSSPPSVAPGVVDVGAADASKANAIALAASGGEKRSGSEDVQRTTEPRLADTGATSTAAPVVPDPETTDKPLPPRVRPINVVPLPPRAAHVVPRQDGPRGPPPPSTGLMVTPQSVRQKRNEECLIC